MEVKSRRERRTTRHDGYGFSRRVRNPIEEVFGSVKTADGGRKLRHCRVNRHRLASLTNFGLTCVLAAHHHHLRARCPLVSTSG